MKKIYKVSVIIIIVITLGVSLVACAPKHNEKPSIDKAKSITLDMKRDEVLELMGAPLAYDSLDIDWDLHGYDMLVYSPEDVEILNWYKSRSSKKSNLQGFTSNLHWTNKNWDRKYYTGTSAPAEVAPMSYILIKIVFKNFELFKVDCMAYTSGRSDYELIHTIQREVAQE